jgi:hypothetical protein
MSLLIAIGRVPEADRLQEVRKVLVGGWNIAKKPTVRH